MRLIISYLLFSAVAQAQTTKKDDPVGNLLGDVVSVYKEATSILAPVLTVLVSDANSIINSAAQATDTASSTSSRHSSSASTTSSSSASSTSSTSSSASSASPVSAATTSNVAASKGKNGGGDHKLAIILGTVLGALVLGLLILLLLICCRRRKKSRSHYTRTNSEPEIERWQENNEQAAMAERDRDRELHARLMGRPTPVHHAPLVVAAQPNINDHPAIRSSQENANPFHQPPEVPPPRRTSPNSRAGLTDGIVPSQDAFVGAYVHDNNNYHSIPRIWGRNSLRRKPVPASPAAAAVPNFGSVPTEYSHDPQPDSDETLLNDSPAAALAAHESRRDTTPPMVPSRSPRRKHFSGESGGSGHILVKMESEWSNEAEELSPVSPIGSPPMNLHWPGNGRRTSNGVQGWHNGVGYERESGDNGWGNRQSIGQAW